MPIPENYHCAWTYGSTGIKRPGYAWLTGRIVASVATETSIGVPHEVMNAVIYENAIPGIIESCAGNVAGGAGLIS
jgi:hypothetical protein